MSSDRLVTMKYLADLAGVNPGLVRRYVKMLRSLVGDSDLFSAQEGSISE
jgi:hypothetical protein